MRGRRYPWGTVNIEDKNHCDFVSLRHLVLAKHMQDLKDVTSQCHYEKYRCEKLTSMALNKEVRNCNKTSILGSDNPMNRAQSSEKESQERSGKEFKDLSLIDKH